jgi:hypothetical protein
MSYSTDLSYSYYSSDDSFSYISDPSPSFYCPVHNPPPSSLCAVHHSYPVYFQVANPQQVQVSPSASSYSSVFQVHPKTNRRFSSEQIRILEEYFHKVDKYLSKVTIDELSTRTQLKPAQIRVWFNNKRTREHR